LANTLETGGWYSLAGGPFVTDPYDSDSDDDGLTDGEEKLFNTLPLDSHNPGLAVQYDDSFKTKQYFSTTDTAYLSMIQGGDRYLMTEAMVVRRGTTFNIAGPATGTLTLAGTGMTASPGERPARGGWTVSLPAGGTVGTYTATVTDASGPTPCPFTSSLSCPPVSHSQRLTISFTMTTRQKKNDEVAVFWTMPEGPLWTQPCPQTDPNKPCSNWAYHEAKGYAEAFWTEQFKKSAFVDHAIKAIQGKTTQTSAAPALANWADTEFRTRSGRRQNSWYGAMYKYNDGTGITMVGGYCESTATVFTTLLRSAGIAARPFALDYNKTAGHGESGQIGTQYEYDHSVMMWLDNTWKAQRAYNGDEVGDLYYPWNHGTTGISLLKDWDTYSGYYKRLLRRFDHFSRSRVGLPERQQRRRYGQYRLANSKCRIHYCQSGLSLEQQVPITDHQSPNVDILNCQMWKGDNWAPSEWSGSSNPAGRNAVQTYYLPSGIPDPAAPLENFPYNPKPTACSASTPADVCNAFKAAWTAACLGIAGQAPQMTLSRKSRSSYL